MFFQGRTGSVEKSGNYGLGMNSDYPLINDC